MKQWLKRKIRRIAHLFSEAAVDLKGLQPQLRAEMDRLKEQIAKATPDNPVLKGFKVYSQTDEDGIIEECLSRIKTNKTFIEIGCGDGRENNTHYLLLQGNSGYWVDGSKEQIDYISKNLPSHNFSSSELRFSQIMIDLDNIKDVIAKACEFLDTKEPDVFSLDIDGNDLFIIEKALEIFKPKIVCVEYNARFPPPLRLSITYNKTHDWASDDYHGASLQMFCDRLIDYRLVCCNLSGVNAFFCRRDLAEVFEQYSIEQLYQPCRFDLHGLLSGHRYSLKWLNDVLAK